MVLGSDNQKLIWDNFRKIKTTEELIAFSYKHALNHDLYSHYTTKSSAKCIMTNKQLKFTNLCNLNDLIEGLYLSEEQKKRYFIFCFSHEITESFIGWTNYAEGGKGIRLSIRKENCKRINSDKIEIFDDNKNIINTTFNLKIMDVIYYRNIPSKKGAILIYDGIENNNFIDNDFSKIVKCNPVMFKNELWKYEFETRIVIDIDYFWGNQMYASFDGLIMSEDIRQVGGPLLGECCDFDCAESKYTGCIKYY